MRQNSRPSPGRTDAVSNARARRAGRPVPGGPARRSPGRHVRAASPRSWCCRASSAEQVTAQQAPPPPPRPNRSSCYPFWALRCLPSAQSRPCPIRASLPGSGVGNVVGSSGRFLLQSRSGEERPSASSFLVQTLWLSPYSALTSPLCPGEVAGPWPLARPHADWPPEADAQRTAGPSHPIPPHPGYAAIVTNYLLYSPPQPKLIQCSLAFLNINWESVTGFLKRHILL